ncbi:MAG: DUF6531 domain-containing protein [Solirubrobacterales bacterium]
MTYVENLLGSSHDDTLTGNENDNTIDGGDGNDTVDGGTGNDVLHGDAGDDTATYASREAPVNLSLDATANDGESGESDNIASDFEAIEGGSGDDTLIGNSGANALVGDDGDDTLRGLAGDDALFGGDGVDTADYSGAGAAIQADLGSGSPQVSGGAGDDTLDQVDNLTGSAYDDDLRGDSANNSIDGGGGADQIDPSSGSDSVDGGAGADDIATTDGQADEIDCGADSDALVHDSLDSSANCEADTAVAVVSRASSAPLLSGEAFAFVATAGDANDVTAKVTSRTAKFHDSAAPIEAGIGCTQVSSHDVSCVGRDVFGIYADLGDEDDSFSLQSTTAMISSVDGGSGNDELTGGAGTDQLDGGTGDDTLVGAAGDDTIYGGDDDDVASAGTGADVFAGGDGEDTTDYSARSDAVNIALDGEATSGVDGEGDANADDVENVKSGSGDDTVTGSDASNVIDPGTGHDVVDSGDGADKLRLRDGDADQAVCLSTADEATTDSLDLVDSACGTAASESVVKITDGPDQGASIGETSPEVAFDSDADSAVFECNLDGAGWSVCTSPVELGPLADGSHELKLRAIVATELTAEVSREFVVDTAVPDVSITSGPADSSTISDPAPAFGFESSDSTASFECEIDDDDVYVCESPFAAAGIAAGDHVVRIRSIDGAGNRSSWAERSFTYSIAPTVAFTDAPDEGSHFGATPPEFEFASATGTSIECAIDGGAFSACTSPFTLTSSHEGRHSLAVRALDVFGAPGATISRSVFFDEGIAAEDTDPPSVFIHSGPVENSRVGQAPVVFELGASEWVSFYCRVDDGDWTSCDESWSLSDLARGRHHVEIGAEDAAGNWSPDPATRDFTFTPDLPPPAERDSGAEQVVDFDLGSRDSAAVNLKTGELTTTSDDFVADEGLTVSRYYRSGTTPTASGLGDRWSTQLDPTVKVTQEGISAVLDGPGGYSVELWQDEDGAFQVPSNFAGTFGERDPSGFSLERWGENDVLDFGSDGELESVQQVNGRVAPIAYRTISGSKVLDEYGDGQTGKVVASYGSGPLLSRLVSSEADNQATYARNGEDQLESVTRADGETAYEYNGDGLLDHVSLAGGTTLAVSYNGEDHVESVTLSVPGEDDETTTFDYSGDSTAVERPDGDSHVYPTSDDDPASLEDPDLADEMSSGIAADESVSTETADAAVALQSRTEGVVDAVAGVIDDNFAGAWYDDAADGGKLHIRIASGGDTGAAEQMIEDLGVGSEVELEGSPNSVEDLTTTQTAIEGELEDLIHDGVVDVYSDDKANAVVIETVSSIGSEAEDLVDDSVSEHEGLAVKRMGGDELFTGSPAGCSYGRGPETSPYYTACNRPLRGAQALAYHDTEMPAPFCSIGFIGKVSTNFVALTAGHCVQASNVAWGDAPSQQSYADALYYAQGIKSSLGLGATLADFENGSVYTNRSVGGAPYGTDAGAIYISSNHWNESTGQKLKPIIAYKLRGRHPKNAYSIQSVGRIVQGGEFCVSGAHSAVHCGDLKNRSKAHTWSDGNTVQDSTRIEIHSNQCGPIGGDSGGSVVKNHVAYGLYIGGVHGGCQQYFTPLVDPRIVQGMPNVKSALEVTNACVLATGDRCLSSDMVGAFTASPKVRTGAVNELSEGAPAIYVTPRGPNTKYAVQFANTEGGHVVDETAYRSVGSDYAETQIPPSDYAKCLSSNEGRFARVVARNSAGSEASGWMEVPSGCIQADKISMGYSNSCAIVTTGALKCWGKNNYGQIGDGTTTDRPGPVTVAGLTSGVAQVSVGAFHSCAVTTGGVAKCWGWNIRGQAGGSSSGHTLVTVSGVSGVQSISAGNMSTCAVNGDDAAVCWGSNMFGELGNSTGVDTQNSYGPTVVGGLSSDVKSVAVGWYSACAVTTNGAAKCWGYNGHGELGNGSDSGGVSTAATVSGLSSGVESISTGGYAGAGSTFCALLTSGSVKCWGANGTGQFGNGTTGSESGTPHTVSGLSNATTVSVGENHVCATTTDGDVKCWGANGSGQLGNGPDYGNQNTPQTVAGLSDVADTQVGSSHSCVLFESHGVKCWGGAAGGIGTIEGSNYLWPSWVVAAILPDPPAPPDTGGGGGGGGGIDN